MELFRPGRRVIWRGSEETVDYVLVRSAGMVVFLHGRAEPCKPEELAFPAIGGEQHSMAGAPARQPGLG